MIVLVHGKYEEDVFSAEEVGIGVKKVDDESYLLTFVGDYDLYQDVVKKSDLPDKDNLGYFEALGAKNLVDYIKSDDESLDDFITFSGMIVASTKLEKVDPVLGYEYECKSGIRFYKDSSINVVNFQICGENDYSGYVEFLDRMLGCTLPKEKTVVK